MSRTIALLAFTAVLSAACDPSSTEPRPVEPLPPLQAATWHVHVAEGQSLPAMVAHRLVNGSLEQDFLDSARVQVLADGGWSRQLWLTRYRGGAEPLPLTEQETGSWVVTDSGYRFTSENGARSFTVLALTPGDSGVFPIRGTPEGYIAATLRVTPPAPTIHGPYRATVVRGVPVPSTIYEYPDTEVDGRRVSVHLVVDSVLLRLHANGTYRQHIHYSEWEGDVNGPPHTRMYRWYSGDFGRWVRTGAQLAFDSEWLQNHLFGGTSVDATAMELQHGLTHGDPVVPIRYGR